jgi:low affinity Fe/Cu permease
MKNIPKTNIFNTPEGYFEKLPEEILARHQKSKARSITLVSATAAAAVIILGMFLFVLTQNFNTDTSLEANLDQEIDLYINSGYWQAEDILSFADNPNSILDEIIFTEWGNYEMDTTDPLEDDWLY